MPGIRANITIDLPDGIDFNEHVQRIQAQISRVSGLKTSISIKEVDDPVSFNLGSVKKVSSE
jgi:hypothetical protein